MTGLSNGSRKTCCSLHTWNTRLAGPCSEVNLSVLEMCSGTFRGGVRAWSMTLGLLRAWDNRKLKSVYSYLLTGAGEFTSTPGPLRGSDYIQPVWSPAAGAPVHSGVHTLLLLRGSHCTKHNSDTETERAMPLEHSPKCYKVYRVYHLTTYSTGCLFVVHYMSGATLGSQTILVN